MLMNNLDPEVAERPDDLVVYGGIGPRRAQLAGLRRHRRDRCDRSSTTKRCSCSRASRSAVFRTHPWAPRVLIANSLLVPAWATWENFRDLEDRGLTMYGQMTAGSWIYIGTQGILQGTYETLAAVARRHFGGTLRGTPHGHRRPRRHGRRPAAGGDDERRRRARRRGRSGAHRAPAGDALSRRSGDVARRRAGARGATTAARGVARSIGLEANAADVLPALVARGVTPDILTDQTSAHDALLGYVPERPVARRGRARCAQRDPDEYVARSMAPMATHVRAMLDAAGARRRDVRLRQQHPRAGRSRPASRNAFDIPASCPSTSARCSARARGRSAGRRSPAIRRTSTRPTSWRSRCSPTTSRSAAGSGWRASASRSRACRRASSGSATASARASAWR